MRAMVASAVAAAAFCLAGGVTHAVSYSVSITDQGMTPSVITSTVNEKVHITIRNNGTKTHNFVLPSFYIFTPNLPAHQGTTVEFTPDKKGAFPFYSDTGGAPEPGISGVLRVN